MKTLIATLLATVAGASFAAAPTAALNHDPATYRKVTEKTAADYKKAAAECNSLSGNNKDVCMAEAKAARARADADAIAKYNNTGKGRESALKKVADADYALAKEKCDTETGADKDNCLNNAKSVHTAALADAKAGRDRGDDRGLVASTGDPAKAAAVAKCEQLSGTARTGCLVDNKVPVTDATGATTVTGATMAERTENAAERAVDKTKAAASAAADKTREVAKTAVDKSRQVASNVAQKTENAMENVGEKTRDSAANVADKSENAANKAAVAASDTAITTKVKASIFKEPDLKAMAIHVETEKGVVMLSGFVESKAEADKAVKVARSIDGVTSVKSAIKVK